MKILLALTFVYGVLYLISYTPLFNGKLTGILQSIFPKNESRKTLFRGIIVWLDMLFFYFSLIYQSWYWLFSGKFIN